MSSVAQTSYTFQGTFVNVKVPNPDIIPPIGVTRGKVQSFSDRSRKRLIDRFHQFDYAGQRCVFMTLTYPDMYPDAKTAKRHLVAFFKRIKRAYPTLRLSNAWRLEFQKRGAPHFHVLWFGLPFMAKQKLWEMWGEVIGYPNPSVQINLLENVQHVTRYVSKYIAKVHDVNSSCFNSMPYSSVLGADFTAKVHLYTGEVIESTGRFWGCWQRQNLPYATKHTVFLSTSDTRVLAAFKREMRVVYRAINRPLTRGATLYVDNAVQWRNLLCYMLHNVFPDCSG